MPVSDPRQPYSPSPAAAGSESPHLFTLRLWQAEVGDGRREWRGRLHHVGHENVSYFRGWAALLPLLLAMLRRAGVTISVEESLNPDA
jgi:hypothetical protein